MCNNDKNKKIILACNQLVLIMLCFFPCLLKGLLPHRITQTACPAYTYRGTYLDTNQSSYLKICTRNVLKFNKYLTMKTPQFGHNLLIIISLLYLHVTYKVDTQLVERGTNDCTFIYFHLPESRQ